MAAAGISTSALTLPSRPFRCCSELSSLHAEISSRYDVVDDHISVGSRSFFILRVRDTNTLLQKVQPEAFARDERLPYWAELWPSSIELARSCLEEMSLQDKSVLELGCGLGLAGIVAAAAGAHVRVSDYEPDALIFAQYNALKNLPQHVVDSRVEFCLLDWRTDQEPEPVDVIIAADVVYEQKSFVPILDFVRRALKKDGWAVFTDPDRSTGMPFFALAEQLGFDVTLGSRLVQHANKPSTILRGELRFGGQHR